MKPNTVVIRSTSGRNTRGALITLEIGSLDPIASGAMGRNHDELRRIIVEALESALSPPDDETLVFGTDFLSLK